MNKTGRTSRKKRVRLSPEDKLSLITEYRRGGKTATQLARKYKVCPATVHRYVKDAVPEPDLMPGPPQHDVPEVREVPKPPTDTITAEKYQDLQVLCLDQAIEIMILRRQLKGLSA